MKRENEVEWRFFCLEPTLPCQQGSNFKIETKRLQVYDTLIFSFEKIDEALQLFFKKKLLPVLEFSL